MRLALALALALALPGCASSPSDPSDGSAPCRQGPGPNFLATASGGGFVAPGQVPRLAEIAHNGTIRVLQGFTQPGNGSVIEATPGALHDLARADALAMMARRGYALDGRDLNVTRGDQATVPDDLYATFCQQVAVALPDLRDRYENARGCADEGSTTWNVSMAGVERTIFVDDCANANDTATFRTLRHEMDTLVGPG